MTLGATDTTVTHVVRVRETQEYDIEVAASGDSRDAAKLARHRFLGMTIAEQASNSIGVTGRTFVVGEDGFDEDELAGDA
jgi:hypothetical protein